MFTLSFVRRGQIPTEKIVWQTQSFKRGSPEQLFMRFYIDLSLEVATSHQAQCEQSMRVNKEVLQFRLKAMRL